MSAAQQRRVQRLVHLIAAAPMLAYVYGADGDALRVAVRAIVVPVIVLTGIVMWQAPRIRRLRNRIGHAGRQLAHAK